MGDRSTDVEYWGNKISGTDQNQQMVMNMPQTFVTTITVQGRDTPVPVGVEMPRIGLAPPSSSDCQVPLVGDQAGADTN